MTLFTTPAFLYLHHLLGRPNPWGGRSPLRNLCGLAKSAGWNSKSNLVITHPTLRLMEACSSMCELKQIQAHMIRTGLINHTFPVSRVLAFCALSNSGDVDHGRRVFAQIEEPNVFIWNTMIRGCSRVGLWGEAFCLFRQMVHGYVPMDSQTFVSMLKVCEQFGTISEGVQIHGMVLKSGFGSQLLVVNGLIHAYVEFGFLHEGRQLFVESTQRDVVTWTSLIDGYGKNKLPDEALKLFQEMVEAGILPNEVTMITVLSACSQIGDFNIGNSIHEFILNKKINLTVNLLNAMIDMYVKCGNVELAREVFDRMRERDVFSWTSMINGYAKCGQLELAHSLFDGMPERNVISWNAMISGYAQSNRPEEALALFNQMQAAKVRPVEGTLVSVLSACAQLGKLDLGRWIHGCLVSEKRVHPSTKLCNALIDMYAKCGNLDMAFELFEKAAARDLVTWNSIISACAVHGHGKQALDLFDQMQDHGVSPDDITFIGVLSACSHAGLVAEGRQKFEAMKLVYKITPKVEHYTCMIDLLGRVGLLEEASDLIRSMPMKPDVAGWGALLNASKMHGNLELGELAADNLLDLDAGDSGIYVLLSNIYAKRKRWEDVKKVRIMMRDGGVKKAPGSSSIEINGIFHEFLVADNSHPESTEIYSVLDNVTLQLMSEGYVPSISRMMDFS
ncbi:Pentatricopeptide repeat-containing protein [Nymphaea thermarum]|nr:Pentatricopeptide repeat-containing protein [Nymphaea thermarum]